MQAEDAAPGTAGAALFSFGRFSFGHLSSSDEVAEFDEAELEAAAEDEALSEGLASPA